MPSFNLIEEPWVPVLDHTGTLHEVGLREVLTRAHVWREVYTDSPLETAALYRLLLALVVDSFLPEPDENAWWALWKAGRFDPAAVDAYFADPRRADRFDLLHPDRPFYQHPKPLAKEPAPLSKLLHAEASGNNATLFSHQIDAEPRPRPLAEAARAIVCAQAAALGGGVSTPFNFSHAPLIAGAIFWIRGRTLFEALLLNAPPDYEARMMYDSNEGPGGPPAWECPLPEMHARRPVRGYRDYLTWQARRLTLVTTERPDGTVEATGVYLTQGDRDDPLVKNDPLMATARPKNRDPFPFSLREERALWRDANTLYRLLRPEAGGSPRTFFWLRQMARAEGVSRYDVDVFGLLNDQAKVEQWRHEQMPVFPALLGASPEEAPALLQVEKALDLADEQARILTGAVRTTADYLLRPPAAGDDNRPGADTKAVTALVNALGAEPRYWAALEPLFYDLLARFAAHANTDFDTRQGLLWEWAEQIFRAARDAFEASTAHLDHNARQLRAVAEGARRLMRTAAYREHRKEETTP